MNWTNFFSILCYFCMYLLWVWGLIQLLDDMLNDFFGKESIFLERLLSSILFEICVSVCFLLRRDSVSSREQQMTFKSMMTGRLCSQGNLHSLIFRYEFKGELLSPQIILVYFCEPKDVALGSISQPKY